MTRKKLKVSRYILVDCSLTDRLQASSLLELAPGFESQLALFFSRAIFCAFPLMLLKVRGERELAISMERYEQWERCISCVIKKNKVPGGRKADTRDRDLSQRALRVKPPTS